MDISHRHSELSYEEWMALPVSSSRPSARYKHAAAVVGEKLYIVGGSRNGRYLSDVQVFDLRSCAWSNLKLKTELNAEKTEDSASQEVLPPMSDHSMIKWGNKLLIVGGHSKKSSVGMIVWYIDLETNVCGVMETSGKVPAARGGHSVTLVGSRLVIFGGEDRSRKLLNDVHVLDLEAMTWDTVETTQTPPAPRYDHTAAVHAERYLLVFGGCSHSIFFSDLHVLDLQTNEWSQPEVQGDLVTARAGHAGIAVDDDWFIVGGGDNRNGCPETIVLDMSKLAWKLLTNVKERDPLASEGLSVSTAVFDGVKHLIAFGGYNGKYNNEDTHLLLTGGLEKFFRILDLNHPDAPPREVDRSPGSVRTIAWLHSDRIMLSSCSGMGGVRLWDVGSGKIVQTLEPKSSVTSAEVSQDGRYITTADGSMVKFWDANQ